MTNKIKILMEYCAGPLYIYDKNEDDGFPYFGEPPGYEDDQELVKLTDEIQIIFNSLWVDNEIVFEYKGFDTKEEEQYFAKLIRDLRDMLVHKFSDKYIIDVSDVEEYL